MYAQLSEENVMREYICTCPKCSGQNHLRFDEPYPQYGDQFVRYCRHCEEDTAQTMVLTKKLVTELRKQKAEEDLKQSITDYCNKYGFACRFPVGNSHITKIKRHCGMKVRPRSILQSVIMHLHMSNSGIKR